MKFFLETNKIVTNLVFKSGYKFSAMEEKGVASLASINTVAPLKEESPFFKEIRLSDIYIDLLDLIDNHLDFFPIITTEFFIGKNQSFDDDLLAIINNYGLLTQMNYYSDGDSLEDTLTINKVFAKKMKKLDQSRLLDGRQRPSYELIFAWLELLNFFYTETYGKDREYLGTHRMVSYFIESGVAPSLSKNANEKTEFKFYVKTLGAGAVIFALDNNFPEIKRCEHCNKKFVDSSRAKNKKSCSEKCRVLKSREKALQKAVKSLEAKHGESWNFRDSMSHKDILQKTVTAKCKKCSKITVFSNITFDADIVACSQDCKDYK